MNGQRPTPAGLKSATPDGPAEVARPPNVPDHELLRPIGSGSYGEVWLARNVLEALRAVKIIYRSRFQDPRPFEREFEGIKRFEPISRSHPSQLAILHVGKNDDAGCFYYVMELADDVALAAADVRTLTSAAQSGECSPTRQSSQSEPSHVGCYTPRTLRSDLERDGRLPPADCVQIGLSLATALGYLHENGLVHRDIKPSNVIFVNGAPKLGDIGLVAQAGDTQSIVGTEGYIPPEGPGTPQADLYSLGKVLYEICTGLDRRRYAELPEEMRTWPDRAAVAELNEIVLKACAKDPARRYPSAEALRSDLALLERGQSVKRKRTVQGLLAAAARFSIFAALTVLIAIGGFLLHRTVAGRYPGASNSTAIRPSVAEGQPNENPEVVKLCKVARFHYYKMTEEGFAKAMDCFNEALQIDSKSVAAYAGIADLCVVSQSSQFLPPKSAQSKMRWVNDKLLAINSGLAERHAVQGYIDLVYDWKPGEADRELKLALELNPDLLIGRIWRAKLLAFTRRFEEAEQEYKNAQQLDPTRYGLNVNAALVPFFARQYDRAIAYLEKAAELMPNQNWAMYMIGRANEESGRYTAAIEAFQKAELLAGAKKEVAKYKYDGLRNAYEKSGQDGYWRKKLAFAQSENGDALEIAQLYAHLGDTQMAFDQLNKAFRENSESLLWLDVDPGWDNIRSEQRFVGLLKRIGLVKGD